MSGPTQALRTGGRAIAQLTQTSRTTEVALGQQVVADGLDAVLAVDRAAVDLVLAVRQPLLTKFMTSVTGIGSAASVAVVLGLFYLAGWHRELTVAAVALTLTGVVVVTLMGTVQRPFPPNPVCVTGDTGMAPHSFPSGHAAAATVYALVAGRSDRLPFAAVSALAVLVALSRMYLGTHYLSDTVAGVAIGAGGFVLAVALLDRFGDRLPASVPHKSD